MTAAKEPPHIRATRELLGLTPWGLRALARVYSGKPAPGGTGLTKLLSDGFLEQDPAGFGDHRCILTAKGIAAIATMRAAGW